MVDKPLIQRKITLLQEKKKELEGYNIKNLEEFKAKGYMQKAVEKMLQEMIEVCLDIGKHIIPDDLSVDGRVVPAKYSRYIPHRFALSSENSNFFTILNF